MSRDVIYEGVLQRAVLDILPVGWTVSVNSTIGELVYVVTCKGPAWSFSFASPFPKPRERKTTLRDAQSKASRGLANKPEQE